MAKTSGGEYFLGIDGGTESIRAGLFDARGRLWALASESYRLHHPRPGWAEQEPNEWQAAMASAVRQAVRRAGIKPTAIKGISCDGTTSSLVFLDASGRPLRPAIIWMDLRAAEQSRRISATGHSALAKTGGTAHIESMLPKALWVFENEPEVVAQTKWILEYTEWLHFKLTGRLAGSATTAVCRWYYDRLSGGYPWDLYERVGLGRISALRPTDILSPGIELGGLTEEAALELGLEPDTPVYMGGADGAMCMIGLGAVQPGRMAFISGSSSLLVALAEKDVDTPTGFFGGFLDGVVPGLYVLEAGQTSTGSVLKWFKDHLGGTDSATSGKTGNPYSLLDAAASSVSPGAGGLVVLDCWQGNRTPWMDPEVRGAIWGLSLAHDRAHIYRAILEGIAYGSRHILDSFEQNGVVPREIVACGGPVRSRFWLQTNADILAKPILTTEVAQAATLGCAIVAATGAGVYRTLADACQAMVRIVDRVEPDLRHTDEYRFYYRKYLETYEALKDLMHQVVRHEAGCR